jgi:hypothetical protein
VHESAYGPERHLFQCKRMSAFREQSGSRRRALEATLLTRSGLSIIPAKSTSGAERDESEEPSNPLVQARARTPSQDHQIARPKCAYCLFAGADDETFKPFSLYADYLDHN